MSVLKNVPYSGRINFHWPWEVAQCKILLRCLSYRTVANGYTAAVFWMRQHPFRKRFIVESHFRKELFTIRDYCSKRCFWSRKCAPILLGSGATGNKRRGALSALFTPRSLFFWGFRLLGASESFMLLSFALEQSRRELI